MSKLKHSLPIVITFLWLGFICSISFMEAPIKFTAPHLTLEVGVEVGRVVFKALNRIEIIFCLCSIGLVFINSFHRTIIIFLCLLAIILGAQTFWLLPALHERIQLIIEGQIPPASYLHKLYIVLDSVKAVCLVLLGISQFGYFREKCLERFFIENKTN
ncbi:hypothetical protein C3K47_10230 [Solitalea longa]|uniref:DUF4149 domain-containing protein n=1 Tax=Solitalea longa TaxID=2079460 RepID=A0A2S5A337_9SPHI|nr:hypothetical protein [Solitalea longa]POY36727.1 hypothetical protein C3K47_10230 [Solitalea longa]